MKALQLLIEPFFSRHGHSQTTRSSIHAYHAILRVEGTLRSVIDWCKERHAKRVAITELEGLSDSLLRDIDVNRGNIGAIVQKRWKWLERPGEKTPPKLKPLLIGELEDLPSVASNDDGVDAAA